MNYEYKRNRTPERLAWFRRRNRDPKRLAWDRARAARIRAENKSIDKLETNPPICACSDSVVRLCGAN